MLSLAFSILLSTTLFFSHVAAQDEECATLSCNPISSLLTKCNLPALSTPFKTYENSTFRNVTQAPELGGPVTFFHVGGPETYILDGYESAKCLCAADIQDVYDCASCDIGAVTDSPEANRGEMSYKYFSDCLTFGYYANASQGFPTITHTAFPTATAPPSERNADCPPCDVIANQLTQCNQTDTSGSRYPPLSVDDSEIVGIDFPDGTHAARWHLMNRTMGECVCTLPVLRRFPACESCAGGLVGGAIEYRTDCRDLGYFSDAEVVPPPGLEGDGNLSSTSSTTQSATGTAPSSDPTSQNRAVGKLEASGALLWIVLSIELGIRLL